MVYELTLLHLSLNKTGDIEAAIYRFEYALRRMTELEQRLRSTRQVCIEQTTQQVKYQTYLGLARCERSRQVNADYV